MAAQSFQITQSVHGHPLHPLIGISNHELLGLYEPNVARILVDQLELTAWHLYRTHLHRFGLDNIDAHGQVFQDHHCYQYYLTSMKLTINQNQREPFESQDGLIQRNSVWR